MTLFHTTHRVATQGQILSYILQNIKNNFWILLPTCILLVSHCHNLIDLYRHPVIFYLCNCTVYITQVRRLVQRIHCSHTLFVFSFPFGGLPPTNLFSLSISLSLCLCHLLNLQQVSDYLSSVWIRYERVSCSVSGSYTDQSCITRRVRLSI
jgi:hypothetical protein